MKNIIKLNIYLIEGQKVDRITYYDSDSNEEIDLIDEELVNHIEMFWAKDLSLDKYTNYIDFSIDGKYLIYNNCNQKIEIGKSLDEFEFNQLCESFEKIHKYCEED